MKKTIKLIFIASLLSIEMQTVIANDYYNDILLEATYNDNFEHAKCALSNGATNRVDAYAYARLYNSSQVSSLIFWLQLTNWNPNDIDLLSKEQILENAKSISTRDLEDQYWTYLCNKILCSSVEKNLMFNAIIGLMSADRNTIYQCWENAQKLGHKELADHIFLNQSEKAFSEVNIFQNHEEIPTLATLAS